jgi:tryptophan halogenase
MTAAALSQRLGKLGVGITLIESSQIGTIGVGEATVPAIKRYFESLGLDAFEVLRATNGTIKLGIEFDGWKHEGHSFMHPFGRYGFQAGPVAFHDLWHRLNAAGETALLDDYSLGTQLARAGKVSLPSAAPRADFEVFDWAVHFDAGRFAQFLRQYSEARGVRRIDARLNEVRLYPESGHIEGLVLDNGETIGGQLFIDCSGFRRLLIEGALKVGYEDWQHWLMCDRAIALPCKAQSPAAIAPYTRSRAKSAGWTWRIPLQNRVGNGYVYSSDHITDDAALAALRADLEGEALAEPNPVRFRAGHVRKLWVNNCVAIGLAGGFLEPLESTAISLVQMGIDKLVHFWPDSQFAPELAREYNRLSVQEYERIRDFIILHYAANGRADGELWRYCRDMALPDSLQYKLELYRARGLLVQYQSESFFEPSWVCMYANFGISARSWDPLAGLLDLGELKNVTRRMRADIATIAGEGVPHHEFLRIRGALSAA